MIGDVVTALNGKTVLDWTQLADTIRRFGEITLTYRRGETQKTVKITPKKMKPAAMGHRHHAQPIYQSVNLVVAMKESVKQCAALTTHDQDDRRESL